MEVILGHVKFSLLLLANKEVGLDSSDTEGFCDVLDSTLCGRSVIILSWDGEARPKHPPLLLSDLDLKPPPPSNQSGHTSVWGLQNTSTISSDVDMLTCKPRCSKAGFEMHPKAADTKLPGTPH